MVLLLIHRWHPIYSRQCIHGPHCQVTVVVKVVNHPTHTAPARPQVPIGAFWVADKHAGLLEAGMHGTTYGGNPLACSVANAVLEVIETEGLEANVHARGEQIHAGCEVPIPVAVHSNRLTTCLRPHIL
jgi:hypothetical protein